MENFNYQQQSEEPTLFNGLEVNATGKEYITEASKWAKFLGILGFISLGLMILGGLTIMTSGSAMLRASGMPIGGGVIGLIYLVGALLFFFPAYYLYKFGAVSRKAMQTGSIADLNAGLGYMKSYFKFSGILAIVIIAFYIIAIVALGMGAAVGM